MSTFTHEMPTNHSARRRGRFIVPVSLHYQIYIFISPHTHFRFITHEYSHYQICVSIPRFVGVSIYEGTINRSPTAANGLPITLLTICENAMFENENYSFISQKRGFINRKSLFRISKQALLFSKHYSLNC